MSDLLRWWNSLSSDDRSKVTVAVISTLITVTATTIIPKVVWPFIKRGLHAVKEFSYRHLAGYGLLHRWARHRYETNLRTILERVTNPWSSEKQVMGRLFVPIKVNDKFQIPHFVPGTKQPEQVVTLRDAAQKYSFFVLVGDPGGGKTLPLKASAWAPSIVGFTARAKMSYRFWSSCGGTQLLHCRCGTTS